MSFDIAPWYQSKHIGSYYSTMSESSKYQGEVPGVSCLIKEALINASKYFNLSDYDNDDDGFIDSLYVIYNHSTYGDFWWAYQYCIFEEYIVDGVMPYFYVFASYSFLKDDDHECNANTFIHETGHFLGLEDYYDTDEKQGINKGCLGGADMMDSNQGDHNPFSKFNLGWINDPLYVNLDDEDDSVTIKLYSYYDYGDCLILANNFEKEKEYYQSYFILSYITTDDLMNDVGNLPYSTNGVKLYRVNGELTTFYENDYQYEMFKYDNSTTKINLIDNIIAKSLSKNKTTTFQDTTTDQASNDDLYRLFDGQEKLQYSDGTELNYKFFIKYMNDNSVQITITKK